MDRPWTRLYAPLLVAAACMLGCTTEAGLTGSPRPADTSSPEPAVTPTLGPTLAPTATPVPTPSPTPTPVVVPSVLVNPTLPPDLQPTEPPATTSMEPG